MDVAWSSSAFTKSQRQGAILAVFFPTDIALYGPYFGMNFVTKDQFGLNLPIYCKVGQNSVFKY